MTTLSVRGINSDVKNAFERAVLKKYGKKHTVMGLEVEKALIFYMSKGQTADLEDFQDQNRIVRVHPQEKNISPPLKVKSLKIRILSVVM